jgi:hypothetical protein
MTDLPIRILFEHGEILTQISDLGGAHRYGKHKRKLGRIIGLAECDVDDTALIESSPFRWVRFADTHPRRVRFMNRARLREAMGRRSDLVTRVSRTKTQARFLSSLTASERGVIEDRTGMTAVLFWRSVVRAVPVFTGLPGLYDNA